MRETKVPDESVDIICTGACESFVQVCCAGDVAAKDGIGNWYNTFFFRNTHSLTVWEGKQYVQSSYGNLLFFRIASLDNNRK